MGKNHPGLILFFLLLLMLAAPACQKKEPATPPPFPAGESRGELHVVSVTPRDETASPREADAVVVIFDRAMVPLEALPEGRGSSFLKMEPVFPGKFRWLGTKTLVFTPEKKLPAATKIKASVPAGTRSLDGYNLTNDVLWSFNTVRPFLVRQVPEDKQRGLKLDTQILLVFNQPVPKEKASKFIFLTGVNEDGNERKVDFRVTQPPAKRLEEETIEAPVDQVLLLEPAERLKPGMKYLVELREGLPSTQGPLGMKGSRVFSFETYKPFRFEGTDIGNPHDPYQPLRLTFSNQVIYKEFIGKIRFEPEVRIPDYYQEWHHGSDDLWLTLPLEPEANYKAFISADLQDAFGNKLGREEVIEFSTSAYPPSVSMTTGFGIIEADEEPNYPLSIMNADKLHVQAANLGREAVVPLLTDPLAFRTNEMWPAAAGWFGLEKTLDLKPLKNKRQAVPLNLRELLPDRFGMVFLQLDTGLPDKWERYPKAFIQVTEMGISAKFSPETNLIWVTELKTGKPVPEADLELRDDVNAVKWRGKTDNEGRAQSPGWKALGIRGKDKWNKPQQWIFARKGKDTAFTSSEWGTGIYPYRFGISYDWNPIPETMRGYLFTERGIYRAGETVHFKGMVRRNEKGEFVLPKVQNVQVEIKDPLEKPVFRDKFPLDEFGSFSFDFQAPSEASLGAYQVQVKVPPQEGGEMETAFSVSFRVEAFRPAEFEVHLRSLKDGFVFGQKYEGEIRADFLFGGAMAGQKASWHLRLNRTSFFPPGHEGYLFGNELDWWDDEGGGEDSRLLSSGEGTLDNQGRLKLAVPLIADKEKDSTLAVLEATVQSPSRRSISSRIQSLVHRGAFYVGLRSETTFLKKDEIVAVRVLASDPEGKLLSGKKVKVKLVKREWRSVRKAGVGRRFQWQTEREDTEVASLQVPTKNEPVQVSFKPQKSGFYVLVAEAKDGAGNSVTTTTSFYVTGDDYVPWERRDDDTIELVADKTNYRPGDSARILVKSPYEQCKALVTVEREFILESRVLDLKGTSTRIDIPIKSEHIPNVYVSVILVQGRISPAEKDSAEDPGKPSFKIGYLNLPVDPSEKRLSVEVKTDKPDYRPKDQVTLSLKLKDSGGAGIPSSLSVAVVDVGVLNLIGYQTPDPFVGFYGEKPLSVQTSETRIHIVGQREYGEKGEETGGGGASLMAAASMPLSEVELRGDFRSTAYWNPSVVANENGEANVSFTLPDNLTSFRVMVVGQTKNSHFGRGEASFRVSKSLLLQPSLPRFSRIGDRFEGGVVLFNQTPAKGTAEVGLIAKGIKLSGQDAVRNIILNPGESREVLFSFEAELPGVAQLEFRAKMGEDTDGLVMSIPVMLPRALETVALSGETDDTSREQVQLPQSFFAGQSKLEVTASATALSGLQGSLDYLTDYPYACLEQRISSLLPYLLAADVIQDFRLSRLSRDEIRAHVVKKILEIYTFQKEDGSFGLWPDSTSSSPYISCYAAFALSKARESGYAVDDFRLRNAAGYLKELLRWNTRTSSGSVSSGASKTVQAFALYDLALLNQPEPAYAGKLFQERRDMSLFGRTLLLKALQFGKSAFQSQTQELLQELLNTVKVTAATAHFEEDENRHEAWVYQSNLRTTAFLFQALLEIGADHPLLPALARWLVDKGKTGEWRSTQENLYAFYALNDYYRKFENVSPDFEVMISLAGKILLDEHFRGRVGPAARAETGLAGFGENRPLPLAIQKKGQGRVYYFARMTYAPAQKGMPRDEGLAVAKKIESPDGRPLTGVKAGSLVLITLEIAVPQESLFVVVDDPLPAGFETVNPAFKTESEEMQLLGEGPGGEKRLVSGWSGFVHTEMRDDKVVLFADSLAPGLHVHRYLARALTPGTFLLPGTKIEQMYAPEIFGRSAEGVVIIIK